MKKIVYVISSLGSCGPVNVLFNLLKNLDRNEFEAIIITLSSEESNSMLPEFKDIDIKIYTLLLGHLQGLLFSGFKLMNLLKKLKPDIIHSMGFRADLISAFFLKSYKRVSTIHADYKIDFSMRYGKLKGFIMNILSVYSMYKIENNICVSKILEKKLKDNYKNIKFDFIDNGIDLAKYFLINDKEGLRKKLFLPLNKKIFVWVGTFIKIKDPYVLVNILSELPANNFSLFFAGKGFY
jgi:glycosyltransferase involved in cell wall biosynthesis